MVLDYSLAFAGAIEADGFWCPLWDRRRWLTALREPRFKGTSLPSRADRDHLDDGDFAELANCVAYRLRPIPPHHAKLQIGREER